MANEYILRNGFISKTNSIVTGSLFVTGAMYLTGSLNINTPAENLNATKLLVLENNNDRVYYRYLDLIFNSGSYTPSVIGSTNVTSSTTYQSYWYRVGDEITVYGKIEIDPTTTGNTELYINLPVSPGNFNNEWEVAGTAVAGNIVGSRTNSARIYAKTGDPYAYFIWDASDISNHIFSFHFTYHYTAP